MGFFKSIFEKKQQPFTQVRRSNIRTIGDQRPSWISLQNKHDYLNAYYSIPPLFSVINYLASNFSKVKFKHYKKLANGKYKLIENSNLIKKIANPNPLQSQSEFIIQLYINWQVFGNANIYNVNSNLLNVNNYDSIINLWSLPMQHINYETTGKLWLQQDIKNIIRSVKFTAGQTSELNIENLIMLNDPNIQFINGQYIIGESKIKAIQKPISNIAANLNARNILLNKRGALGILSNRGNVDGLTVPIRAEEKQNIQNDYLNYGLNDDQWQIIITDAQLDWQQISLPISDMMLEEQYRRDKIEICDAYSFPILILNESEGATYSNLAEAKKQLYENKIIPDWILFEFELNKYFELESKNEYLELCYDHIEVLQKDRKTMIEISEKETNIILKVQDSINKGSSSFDSGVAILINALSYTDELARKMLNEKIKENATTIRE